MPTMEQIRAQFPQYSDVSDGDLLIGLHKKYYPDMHVKSFIQSIDGAQNAHVTIQKDDNKAYWRENVSKPIEGEDAAQTDQRLYGSADGPVGNPGGKLGTAGRSFLQGGTFGFGDEIVAGGISAISDIPYDQALQAERDRLELGRQQNPKTALASEIGGALAAPAAVLKGGGSLASQTVKSAALAGAEGTTYGFGAGEGGFENRLDNAKTTGAIASIFGAGAPVLARYGKRVFDRASLQRAIKKAGKSAPSLDELKRMASDIYEQADNVKNLPRGDFANKADDMLRSAERKGLDADLTPGASKAMSRIEDAATAPDPNIGFRELDILRKKAQVPAGNLANRTESAIGTGMVKGVDEFVEAVDPNLSGELNKARAMWRQLRASEMINQAVDEAGRQASGFENGLRIKFRAILNNPKKSKGLTEAEKFAMQQVVDGTTLGNIMKKIGKMGVGLGQQSNFVGAGMGTGAGAILGSALGPAGSAVGAVAAPALGTLAQKGSERSTRMATEALQGLVRSGGVSNVPKLSGEAQGLLESVIRSGNRTVQPLR